MRNMLTEIQICVKELAETQHRLEKADKIFFKLATKKGIIEAIFVFCSLTSIKN